MWHLPLPFCKIIKKCVNANAKCSCQNLDHQLALSLLLLAYLRETNGCNSRNDNNRYSMEPKRNRNIFCHFFCQEIHMQMQFETTYCKQMHFVQVSEPFVGMATWRPGNSFSNPTIPCRFSDELMVVDWTRTCKKVVPSVTRLVSMEADVAPFTPLPLSVLRFTGIQNYGYTDQRKVETDVEVTEDFLLKYCGHVFLNSRSAL